MDCASFPGRGFVGKFPIGSKHDISGDIYVKDNKTLVIRNFTYSGRGPGLSRIA